MKILFCFISIPFILFSQVVSPVYIGLSSNVSGAELRGITSTATAALTVVGNFISDRRQYKFDIITTGQYKLFTDTGGGFAEDTTWAGSGADGLAQFGGDVWDGFLRSVDGVSNPGSNVDFIAGTGMTITPNNIANNVTFTSTGGGGGGGVVTITDTTLFPDITGGVIYLVQLDSVNNPFGGGWFSSSVDVDLVTRFGANGAADTPGYIYPSLSPTDSWVRNNLLDGDKLNIINFGAIPNDQSKASENTTAIQGAVDYARIVSGYSAFIPEGKFWVNKSNPGSSFALETFGTVKIKGVSMEGSGTSGSILILNDNQNCTVISDSSIEAVGQWWHWGGIEDIMIDCNGDNNTIANAIDIYQPGEISYIKDVYIRRVKGYGIAYRGSKAPAYIENVTVNPAESADSSHLANERIGFLMEGSGRTTLTSISGDHLNPWIKQLNGGEIVVNGLKAEGNVGVFNDSTCVIWCDNLSGVTDRITLIGLNVSFSTAPGPMSVFRLTNAGTLWGASKIVGFKGTNYRNLWINVENADTVGDLGQNIGSWQEGGNSAAVEYFKVNQSIHNNNSILLAGNDGVFDGHIKVQSNNDMAIKWPHNFLNMQRFDGTTLFTFGASVNTSKVGLELDKVHLEFIEAAAPIGAPNVDRSRLYLEDIGGESFLLAKFNNGKVDTLAASVAFGGGLPPSIDTIRVKRKPHEFELNNGAGFADPVVNVFAGSWERNVLDFADTAIPAAHISFTPQRQLISADNIWIDIYWFSSATTGGVAWGINRMFSTEGSGAASGIPGVTQVIGSTNGVANTYNRSRITITAAATIGITDDLTIRIRRTSADAGDTMTADARVQWVIINYLSQ